MEIYNLLLDLQHTLSLLFAILSVYAYVRGTKDGKENELSRYSRVLDLGILTTSDN